MLSRGILAVEGISELTALPVASELLASSDPAYFHLDLSGVCVIERSGDGGLEALGSFFRSLGIRTFTFYDKPNDPALDERLKTAFDVIVPNPHKGLERLLVEELPIVRIRAFAASVPLRPDAPSHLKVPVDSASNDDWKTYLFDVLKNKKGEGYAADLLRTCVATDLPHSVVTLLRDIFACMNPPVAGDMVSPEN